MDAPIGRHPTDRKKMCVTQRSGRNAVTHWEVIKRYRGYTHVRCRLETGRTHQIRVHMAHLGHPILGDTVYGRKKPELGQSSQVLHAGILCFKHPRDEHPVVVLAELPDYFKEVLQKLASLPSDLQPCIQRKSPDLQARAVLFRSGKNVSADG